MILRLISPSLNCLHLLFLLTPFWHMQIIEVLKHEPRKYVDRFKSPSKVLRIAADSILATNSCKLSSLSISFNKCFRGDHINLKQRYFRVSRWLNCLRRDLKLLIRIGRKHSWPNSSSGRSKWLSKTSQYSSMPTMVNFEHIGRNRLLTMIKPTKPILPRPQTARQASIHRLIWQVGRTKISLLTVVIHASKAVRWPNPACPLLNVTVANLP